jgi:septal ring factor EnvC (AmiA/AmiB activator)
MANRSSEDASRRTIAGVKGSIPIRWLRCAGVAVVLIAGATLTAQTPAPSGTAADAAAQRAAERIRALQRESDTLAKQERTLLVDLRRLEVERALKTEELTTVERQLRDTRAQLEATAARAAALGKTAATERPGVERRLVQLYKLGHAGYWRLLLDSSDLRTIGRAYRTAAALNRLDRERVQQHQRTLEALARERQSLEARVKEIARLQERAVAARNAADRAVASRTALVASIDARRDLNAQLAGELEAAQQRLQGTVAQLGARGPVMLPLRPFRGALPWPASGIVIGRFGRTTSSRFGTSIPRNGIEISLAEDEPVRAVHEGTVAFADQFTGYGNLIIVDHGDTAYSLYGYLLSMDVARGAHVDAQTRLGSSGRNPSGNPALYFELRIDGKPVDPLQWLKR